MKKIMSFLMKSFMTFSFFIVNTTIFWRAIKVINKLFKRPIVSMFVTYPAEKRYAKYYTFDWVFNKFQWKMGLIGIHHQNGHFGLNFAIATYEEKLIHPDNKEKFSQMIHAIIEKKDYANIQYINYGGVIPSYVDKRGLPTYQSAGKELIAEVIVESVYQMLEKEHIDKESVFCYILGGRGFIGTEVANIIEKKGHFPYLIVEKDDNYTLKENISNNKNHRVIINVSRKGVFESYAESMDNNCLLLNEVFPPPRIKEVNLKAAYHLKGIKAKVIPSMPYDYSNVMPCCSLVMDPEKETNFDVVIKKIQ